MSPPATPSTRQLSWMPLFVPRGGAEPLATTLMLPPLERRRQSYVSLASTGTSSESSSPPPSSSGSSSSCHSSIIDPDSPTSATFPHVNAPQLISAQQTSPTGLGFRAAVSSSVWSGPAEQNSRTAMDHGGMMQRGQSSQGNGVDPNGNHFRRRSSSTVLIGGQAAAEAAAQAAQAARMQRMRSLTSVMDDPLNQKRNSTWHKVHAFNEKQRRRARFHRNLQILFATVALYALWRLGRVSSVEEEGVVTDGIEWTKPAIQFRMPTPQSLYDSLETVPYPTSTHPRTPPRSERHKLAFSDYLTTRLGSHFSFPTSLNGAATRRPTHLWMTTATNSSVRLSTRHLGSFVDTISLDKNLQRQSGQSADFTDSNAIRKLVVLCRDDGCMDYCREHSEMYCFGGFIDSRDDGVSKEGEEIVKLKGTVAALESGRRVFFVDDDVYFREDPVPHLGALDQYDLQIPDSWATGKLNAGFIVLNPTSNVISLWQRLLDITLVPAPQRRVWSTTNLLLDPSGADRDHSRAHSLPPPADKINTEDDGIASSYGQSEFESPWAGGIDVKVLDRKRFRTSSGKLSKLEWEKDQQDLALYHHCVCCGDAVTNDYIAGALGYHQPEVAYPHLNSANQVESHFPFVLKTPTLRGSRENLTADMALLLQLAHDSKRAFVPPLKGTLVQSVLVNQTAAADNVTDDSIAQFEEKSTERYIWRLFPIAHWSTKSTTGPGSLVSIKEPAYASHLVSHLKTNFASSRTVQRQLQEVQDTLYLDLTKFQDYKAAVRALTRPFLSTTRIVLVEGLDRVRGDDKWLGRETVIRDEFRHVVETCKGLDRDVRLDEDNDARDEEGHCLPLCVE
ncbi:hypothetical protein ACM66B_003974 [Microbotryomycetes sp. NB124-2]